MWMPPSTRLDTRFEVVVMLFNLAFQPDAVRALFAALERRWLVRVEEVLTSSYQEKVRSALDDAASLIGEQRIPHHLYRQECEVVDRATALAAGHG